MRKSTTLVLIFFALVLVATGLYLKRARGLTVRFETWAPGHDILTVHCRPGELMWDVQKGERFKLVSLRCFGDKYLVFTWDHKIAQYEVLWFDHGLSQSATDENEVTASESILGATENP
jgi:hypothetical protein